MKLIDFHYSKERVIMLYITKIHGLNLNCELDTCGDWHTSGIQWHTPKMKESEGSIFGDYGIEPNKTIPESKDLHYVANHIRSLLDMLVDGDFGLAQGMRKEFICNEKYTLEIFEKVMCLNHLANWNYIDSFIEKEYLMYWLNYKNRV